MVKCIRSINCCSCLSTFRKIFCIQGLLSEVEVKYKMSECYLHMKEYREATTTVSEMKLILFFCNSSKEDSFSLPL